MIQLVLAAAAVLDSGVTVIYFNESFRSPEHICSNSSLAIVCAGTRFLQVQNIPYSSGNAVFTVTTNALIADAVCSSKENGPRIKS